MDRNNTSFPLILTAKLKVLYKKYLDEQDAHKAKARILKYFQYIPCELFYNPNFQIKGARGLLIYASPGLGKTHLAVAVAAEAPGKVVVFAPSNLHANFEHRMKEWIKTRHIDYVSTNAFNSGEQMDKINLEGSLIIVDEAHLFFRGIINGAKNAQHMYNTIMMLSNIKLLFL